MFFLSIPGTYIISALSSCVVLGNLEQRFKPGEIPEH